MKKIFFIIIFNGLLFIGQLWTVANFGDGGQKWANSQKMIKELDFENEALKKEILAESTIESYIKKSEEAGFVKMRIEYVKLPSIAQKIE